jgi:ribonuclease Z
MEIIFVGTGSGKTSSKRFHSSFIIKSSDYNLLVDAGDGVSKALIKQNISFQSIDGILITHLHADHYSGLASLIVQMKLTNRTKKLDIFIHQSLADAIKKFIFSSYIFMEKMDFEIKYNTFTENEVQNITSNINFIAKQNSHLNKYIEYDHNKELSFSCCSFLFNLNGNNLLYSGDIGGKDDLYLFKGKQIKFFISEITHIELKTLVEVFKELKAEKLYLTHISDEDEANISNLITSISGVERDKIIPAYDSLNFAV